MLYLSVLRSSNLCCVKYQARFLSHGAIAATLGPHKYSPLIPESREFRLLSLLPAERSKPIKVKLSRVKLAESRRPRWTCLSYSWRNFEEQNELIWVDEQPFLVTSNLHKAMLHLRLEDETQTLWIDQICINQQSIAERSWQVRLMGDIFQSADSVLAWLGADDWVTRTAIELVSHLSEADLQSKWLQESQPSIHPAREPRHGRWLLQRLLTLLEDDESNRIPFDDGKAVLVRLFSKFLHNPWFSRLWIVQEAALADRLELQCGHFRADWNACKAAIDTLHLFSRNALQSEWEKFMSIHHIRQARLQGSELTHFSPSALVRHHRYREALDDRDKIFAIVGLCDVPDLKGWVDYDRTVESIYTSFVRRCVSHERNLDVLNGCCGPRVQTGYELPSWATDWTESRSKSDGSEHHCGLVIVDAMKADENAQKMSRADLAIFQSSSTGNEISLRGYHLDTVEYVYAGAHHPALIDNPASATWSMWEEKFRRHWHWRSSEDPKSHLEAFWRTMSATYVSDDHGIGEQFHLWWSLRNAPSRSPGDLELCDEWLARLHRVVRSGSRIFFTQSGRVGLTCEHARPGDMLCLLEGGRNLFLLRKGEEMSTQRLGSSKYVLIGGETFVDNFDVDSAREFVHLADLPSSTFNII